ncbi:MAG TPA: SWIM zinc finger family protein [Blastocatellia bacterium]
MAKNRGHREDFYDYFFERRSAIATKGGIKAQSKGSQFGGTWWARRWIQVLESFNIGGRLARGRTYARKGQVVSIDIAKGVVNAQVQGSRPAPYRVLIEVKQLSALEWQRLAQALNSQAIFAAKLLAGEMPQDIEEAFKVAGLSLFPEKLRDLKTECSCPDYSNPCKHIAAVYYLLGEEFDRDPFLIFKLRGMTREGLLALLGAHIEEDVSSRTEGARVEDLRSTKAAVLAEPISSNPAEFWNGGGLPDDFFGDVNAPPVAAALPKRLGSFPFWRGSERFLEALENIYVRAGQRGLNAFLGDPGTAGQDSESGEQVKV